MYFSSLKIVRRRQHRSAKKTAKKNTNFFEVSFKVLKFLKNSSFFTYSYSKLNEFYEYEKKIVEKIF